MNDAALRRLARSTGNAGAPFLFLLKELRDGTIASKENGNQVRAESVEGEIDGNHRTPFTQNKPYKGTTMLSTILLIILILILVGTLPAWGHSRSWGYGPSGLTFVLLIILIVLLATGRI